MLPVSSVRHPDDEEGLGLNGSGHVQLTSTSERRSEPSCLPGPQDRYKNKEKAPVTYALSLCGQGFVVVVSFVVLVIVFVTMRKVRLRPS